MTMWDFWNGIVVVPICRVNSLIQAVAYWGDIRGSINSQLASGVVWELRLVSRDSSYGSEPETRRVVSGHLCRSRLS